MADTEDTKDKSSFRIPASLLVPLLTALLGVGGGHTLTTMAGTNQIAAEVKSLGENINKKLEAQNTRLFNVERSIERIEERAAERWTKTEMKLWVSELRRRNPNWDIPEAN